MEKVKHSFNESSLTSFCIETQLDEFEDTLFFGELDFKAEQDFPFLVAALKDRAVLEKKNRLVGPINQSTYFDYRLKLNFFEEPGYVGEPRNSKTRVQQFEDCGFRVLQKYFSHEFKIVNMFMIFWLGGVGLLARLGMWAKGYRIVPLTAKDLIERFESIHQIIHEIFGSNFLYSPITSDQFLNLVKEKYLPSLDERSSLLLINPEGECVGFNLCLKDSNRPDRVLFKAHGVKRWHRSKGLASLSLMGKAFIRLAFDYRSCLACLTISGSRIDGHFHKLSHKHYEYGLYELKLEPSPSP